MNMNIDNKWIQLITITALILIFTGTVSVAHSQTTRYVAPNGSDVGSCANQASPCESIAYAFTMAGAGDVIDIATGVYRPNPGLTPDTLVIDKDITIQGAGPENTLVGRNLQDSAYRIFEIAAGGHEVSISGLVIANGQAFGSGASGRGGGIYNLNAGGQLVLSNVKFQSNQARIGGGLNNFNGAMVIMENVVFESNQANERGGAIYNWTDGIIEVSASQFETNTAGIFAGAIFNNSNNILVLDDVEFNQNHGVSGCGAIAMNNANQATEFKNTHFIGNTTGGIGGAICLDGSSPTLGNVTFTDNQALATSGSGLGGGMRNFNNSSPVLTQVTFTGNYAASLGGGIYNSGNSSPQLNGVQFIANESGADGGGMANVDASHPMLVNVIFESNLADNSDGEGGGMLNDASNPDLLDVLFLDNSARRGGGLLNRGSSQPLLRNVRFNDNQASRGGGVANFAGSPTLINGLFHGNTATWGGGMYNADDTVPILWNVSFGNNTAISLGGAMYNTGNTNVVVHNSIFWGSSAQAHLGQEIANFGGASASLHFSLHADAPLDIYTDEDSSFSCTNCLTDDPQFVNSLYGDLRLMLTSPAIDAGNPGTDLSQFPGGPDNPIDLLGWSRVFGTQIDIGAFEWQPPPDAIFKDRFENE
jgi:predicted outer membrane repeat protein